MPHPIETKEVWGHQVSLELADDISKSWFGLQGLYDRGMTEEQARDWWRHYNEPGRALIRPRDLVLDVGCNRGFTSCVYGLAATEGHVIGFDPVEHYTRQAVRNVKLNKLNNVVIKHMAIGSPTLNSVHVDGDVIRDYGKRVDCKSLDCTAIDLFRDSNLTGPHIKIDVEGYEGRVLNGATKLLAQRDCRLEVELHLNGPDNEDLRNYGDTVEGIVGLLRDFGFRVCRPKSPFYWDKPIWEDVTETGSIKDGCLWAWKEGAGAVSL